MKRKAAKSGSRAKIKSGLAASSTKGRRLPGDLPADRQIERLIRVDHAGEFGAQRIYAGQIAVLGDTKAGETLRHMAKQEDVHLAAFEKQLHKRKVRPTALHPVWNVAGYVLGYATASLGVKAAMACTIAVEEVIDEHYRAQLAALPKNEKEIRDLITKFRDEEIEHKNIGVDHGGEDLPYYAVLRSLVRAGSRAAIWLSERV